MSRKEEIREDVAAILITNRSLFAIELRIVKPFQLYQTSLNPTPYILTYENLNSSDKKLRSREPIHNNATSLTNLDTWGIKFYKILIKKNTDKIEVWGRVPYRSQCRRKLAWRGWASPYRRWGPWIGAPAGCDHPGDASSPPALRPSSRQPCHGPARNCSVEKPRREQTSSRRLNCASFCRLLVPGASDAFAHTTIAKASLRRKLAFLEPSSLPQPSLHGQTIYEIPRFCPWRRCNIYFVSRLWSTDKEDRVLLGSREIYVLCRF